MPVAASAVLAQAALLLNDPSQVTWTNTILLPCLIKANEELEQEMGIHQLATQKEESSPVVSVEIGDTQLDELPTDIIQPITLFERTLNSSEDWVEVDEAAWIDKNLRTSSQIVQWSWRKGIVFINPPQTDREVYLRYLRSINPIASVSSNLELDQSKGFLAARTAQIAARDLGNAPGKADSLEPDVVVLRDKLIRRLLKKQQGISGVRRRAFKGRSRIVW